MTEPAGGPYELGGEVRPVDRGADRVQILALSGGGYRGLYTASVLERIQAGTNVSLVECFDVLAGTSIGGILAIALAAGVQPAELTRFFIEHGRSIFRPKRLKSARRLTSALYDAGDLEQALRSALGARADMPLSDLSRPLMVVAISRAGARPELLRSGAFGRAASELSLLDAALATSAAPTYFPARRVGEDHLLDGGLVANAPDLAAIIEVGHAFRVPLDCVHVLSIGTAGMSAAAVGTPPGGALKWVTSGDLVNLTMEAQETLALDLARKLLPDGRHWRIDRAPAPGMEAIRPMDAATDEATATLLALAGQTMAEITEKDAARLAGFLAHTRHLGVG